MHIFKNACQEKRRLYFSRALVLKILVDGKCSIMVSDCGNECPFSKAQLIADFWVNRRGRKNCSGCPSSFKRRAGVGKEIERAKQTEIVGEMYEVC
jgi:hypothetical protein